MGSLPLSVIICHDKRYPELVRLPVLRGARLVVYISHETWHDDGPVPRTEAELGPYRAQVVARAVENGAFCLHANACGSSAHVEAGSHGRSRVISPRGVILAEGGIDTEELVSVTLSAEEQAEATALYARKSLLSNYALSDWWEAALEG